jgi:hypothetical protein
MTEPINHALDEGVKVDFSISPNYFQSLDAIFPESTSRSEEI